MESIHIELTHKGRNIGMLEVLPGKSIQPNAHPYTDRSLRQNLGEICGGRHDETLIII